MSRQSALFQRATEATFQTTGTVLRGARTPNGRGGYTAAPRVPAGTLRGRLGDLTKASAELVVSAQVQDRRYWEWHYRRTVGDTPATADPATGTYLTAQDAVEIAGVVYELSHLAPLADDAPARMAILWRPR